MIRLLPGDCRDVLPTLPANSVHCVVCSPPYYGLRDYGTAQWEGGAEACDHLQPVSYRSSTLGASTGGRSEETHARSCGAQATPYRDTCGKCGARRIDRQLGLEATPDEYLADMVAVFREVRRVLRPDGVCFVNMGDSYATSANGRSAADTKAAGNDDRTFRDKPFSTVGNGYKPKDLLMMPARLAIELQRDGWWLRSDIIWAKPNPMPESVTDRPTNAHEHVFLLTKRSRYFYDTEAVREERTTNDPHDAASYRGGCYLPGQRDNNALGSRTKYGDNRTTIAAGRNLRNVWTIATEAFPQSHFATFPTQLVERCIRAGTSEHGCCAQWGAPWVRIIDRETRPNWQGDGQKHDGTYYRPNIGGGVSNDARTRVDRGWAPSCKCNADVVPATVLDCFAGAGTTLLVADRLQRDAIGIDLNTQYVEMAMQRRRDDAPLFSSWPPADDPDDARMADLFADDEYHRPSSAVPTVKRDAFRNSERYVNQGPSPSNGLFDYAAD